jgi:hypothetical protein
MVLFFGVETGNGRLLNLAGDRRLIDLMRLIHPAGHISADRNHAGRLIRLSFYRFLPAIY